MAVQGSSGTSLSRGETLTLLTISGASLAVLANTFSGDGEPLIASLALSCAAFALCYAMIRWLGPTFIKAGFRGRDLSKVNKVELPECMGAVCAAVYLLTVIVFIPFPFYKDIVAATSGGGNRDVVLKAEHVNEGRFLHRFPHSKVCMRLAKRFSKAQTNTATPSLLRTWAPSSPCRLLLSSESATTSLTFAGGTSGGSPAWPPSPSSSSTLSTLT